MYQKKGYLEESSRLFYVCDQSDKLFPSHYHDFDKLTLFLQGRVQYEIEGKTYGLQPFDIVLVRAGQLHRPIVSSDAVYERIIAYMSPAFFKTYEDPLCDLYSVFTKTPSPVLRQPQSTGSVYGAACRLRQSFTQAGKKPALLQNTIFLEFMIQLSLSIQEQHIGYVATGRQNEKIQTILTYINDNVAADLAIPAIASHFYMSPDYLMHLFKAETGYSLGTYITTKRLLLARQLLQQGKALTDVCYDSGFKNYSTFYRAWKQRFHQSPRKGLTGINLTEDSLD